MANLGLNWNNKWKSRISASAKNRISTADEFARTFTAGIMEALEDSDTKADKLSLKFLSTISSNQDAQDKAQESANQIDNYIGLLKTMDGWDDSYTQLAQNHFWTRAYDGTSIEKVYGELKDAVAKGDIVQWENPQFTQYASSNTFHALPEEMYSSIMNDFKKQESSGNSKEKVLITEGSQKGTHAMGWYGFTEDRLAEYAKKYKIPYSTAAEKNTFNKVFLNRPELQNKVMMWHLKDFDNRINKNPHLKNSIGKTINGVRITRQGLIAMAHLGGFGGMKTYIETKGRKNVNDQFGTTLKNYSLKFQNSGLGANLQPKKDDTFIEELRAMFGTNAKAEKRAIKLAVSNLGLTEDEAKSLLRGEITQYGTAITPTNFRLRVDKFELPDSYESALSLKMQLDSDKSTEGLSTKRKNVLDKRITQLESLMDEFVKTKISNRQLEDILDPKNIEAFSFEHMDEIVDSFFSEENFNKEIRDKSYKELNKKSIPTGWDLFIRSYKRKQEAYTDLSRMPEVPDINSITDYKAYELEVFKTFNITPTSTDKAQMEDSNWVERERQNLPYSVRTVLKGLENSITLESAPDNFTDLYIWNWIKNNGTDNLKTELPNLLSEFKKLEMESEIASKIPSNEYEAMYLLERWGKSGEVSEVQRKVAERILREKATEGEKGVWVRKTDIKFGKAVNTTATYQYVFKRKNYETGKSEYTLTDLNRTPLSGSYIEASEDEVNGKSKIITQLSTDISDYNEERATVLTFMSTSRRLSEIVNEQPEALKTVTGLFGGVKGAIGELDTLMTLVNSTISQLEGKYGVDMPDGTKRVPVDVIERELLKDPKMKEYFGDVSSFEEIFGKDVTDAVNARKQFLAGSVLLVFRTGKSAGQTGYSMSNKDYDRFAKFLLGFKDQSQFNRSLNNFMNEIISGVDRKATTVNNHPSVMEHNRKFGVKMGRIVPTFKNFVKGDFGASNADKDNYQYFTSYNETDQNAWLELQGFQARNIATPVTEYPVNLPMTADGQPDHTKILIIENIPEDKRNDAWDALPMGAWFLNPSNGKYFQKDDRN